MPSWNWPAFVFSVVWFSYRRMNGYAVINFFLPIAFLVLAAISASSGATMLLFMIYLAVAFVLIPMYADYGPRARVSEGVSLAGAMKNDINDFYARNKRLPAAQ